MCLAALAACAGPAAGQERAVAIRSQVVRAEVHGLVASTTIEQTYVNYTDEQQEVAFQWRTDPGAAAGELALWVNGLRSPGALLPRSSARRIYQEIVDRRRDPAILEYAGDGLWQLRVFPIPPEGTQKVQLVVQQVLRVADGKVVYRAPRLVGGTVTEAQDFEFSATVTAPGGVADIKPLDQAMGAQRTEAGGVLLGFRQERFRLTDPVGFAFSAKAGTSSAASASDGDGAVFAAVTPPLESLAGKTPPARTVVVAVDRSASMKGDRLRMAVAAAGKVLARLRPADSLAVLLAGADVALWKDKLVPATAENVAAAAEFLKETQPAGGTDLAAVLRAAETFNTDPARGFFIVLISDGQDVVGAAAADRPADKAPGKTVALPANARLLAVEVGGGYAMGPLSDIPDVVLFGLERGSDLTALEETLTETMDVVPVTDLKVQIEPAAGVTEVAASHPALGREIVLAGMLAKAAPARVTVRRTGKLYGQVLSDTVEVDIPAPEGPEWLAPALRQVWAHLRAEGLVRGLAREDVKPADLRKVLDLARRHRVVMSVTALLVLESDEEYMDRGIDRLASGIDPKRSLREAQSRLADVAFPLERVPASSMAILDRANELRRLGDYGQAVTLLDKFLADHFNHPAVRRERDLLVEVLTLREEAQWQRESRQQWERSGMDWRTVLQPWLAADLVRAEPDQVARVKLVPRQSPLNQAAMAKLGKPLPKITLSEIPFGDVIQFFRDVTGLSIHVKRRALQAYGVDEKTPVSVELAGVPAGKALRVILEDAGGVNPLGFIVDEGVVTISTRDDLSTLTTVRVYDIRDLASATDAEGRYQRARQGGSGLYEDEEVTSDGWRDTVPTRTRPGGWGGLGPAVGDNLAGPGDARINDMRNELLQVRRFRAPRIGLSSNGNFSNSSSGGLFGGDDDSGHGRPGGYLEEWVDSVLDMIRITIAPDSWMGGAAAGTSGSVRYLGGTLVVRQTPANHLALADLLEQLRECVDPALAQAVPGPAGPEAMFTQDGRITAWVADLLAKAGGEGLSRFSSVQVRKAGGRTFARIGGVWLDTSLTGADRIRVVRRESPAAEVLLRDRAKLAECFQLGPFVAVRAAEGVAVTLAPYGMAKAEDKELAAVIDAMRR
ncbi:MAG TPA: VIT and VWA domain-containing protein [Phycisphaerae bacterium]|nr:VIT and VWA domain-containing protein [Phycisphaerae bacterium]